MMRADSRNWNLDILAAVFNQQEKVGFATVVSDYDGAFSMAHILVFEPFGTQRRRGYRSSTRSRMDTRVGGRPQHFLA
ncbi:hypothetical protein A2U01_0003293 [Trifolium medium]|uniref:Uncharacterized protein n=1 Tax=Trifolium medium TaxID=97028 RepID=A0A392M574_9FABA|nr:hypothetical protein [Trifolium medium]